MRSLTRSQGFEVAFWLALAAAVFGLGFVYDEPLEMYRYGTVRWPQALAVLMALAALGQLYTGLRGGAAKGEAPAGVQPARAERLAFRVRLGAAIALPVVYTLLLERTGYYFTTPLFLAGYLFLAGERRIKLLVAVPLATHVVLTFVFTTLLYLGLPIGYWPGFYELNNWIVGLFR